MKMITCVFVALSAVATTAHAQMPPQMFTPLTEWRSQIDADLSKLSMPRDAHAAVFNILQAYERQAQIEKARDAVAKAKAEVPQ